MNGKKNRKIKIWSFVPGLLGTLCILAVAAFILCRTRGYDIEGNSYYSDNTIRTWIENDKFSNVKTKQEIAKTIDPKLMEQYTKRRKDNIFPVMVPVRDSSCGGCHMELPVSMMNKLKEDGILSCEHCRRIIYNV